MFFSFLREKHNRLTMWCGYEDLLCKNCSFRAIKTFSSAYLRKRILSYYRYVSIIFLSKTVVNMLF